MPDVGVHAKYNRVLAERDAGVAVVKEIVTPGQQRTEITEGPYQNTDNTVNAAGENVAARRQSVLV